MSNTATPTFVICQGSYIRRRNAPPPINRIVGSMESTKDRYNHLKKLLSQQEEKLADLDRKGLEEVQPRKIRSGDILYISFSSGPESRVRYWKVTKTKCVKTAPYHYEFSLKQENSSNGSRLTVRLGVDPNQYVVRKKRA